VRRFKQAASREADAAVVSVQPLDMTFPHDAKTIKRKIKVQRENLYIVKMQPSAVGMNIANMTWIDAAAAVIEDQGVLRDDVPYLGSLLDHGKQRNRNDFTLASAVAGQS
jgi:hypothetical protein